MESGGGVVTALDLSALSAKEKTLAGRVVIQVLNDLRYFAVKGATIDESFLNNYEGEKLVSLRHPGLTVGGAS